MCGIVGFVERDLEDLAVKLVQRLSHLEYRGYDSAGIVIHDRGLLRVTKAVGDLSKLRERLGGQKGRARVGLAHTRWATHGAPSERNALPIATADGSMAIVFNGIVENNFELREKLGARGVRFQTDNDAETLLLWIAIHDQGDIIAAIREALASVKGRYAFVIATLKNPDSLIAAKRSSPLVVGIGPAGCAIASDLLAISTDVTAIHYLADDTIVLMQAGKIDITNLCGEVVIAEFTKPPTIGAIESTSDFDTFTLKEIYAQPQGIADGIRSALANQKNMRSLGKKIDRAVFIGCGTALHACMIGKNLVERFAGIPAEVNIASEFHTASPVLNNRTLTIFISQSGETADTLACMDLAKSKGCTIVVICNVTTSTLARGADLLLPLDCGLEIGVASTKAYSGMLIQVAFLAMALGIGREALPKEAWEQHERAADVLPSQVKQLLANRGQIERIARSLRERRNFAFIGRDVFYPTACEGALKLRELTYRNAEGFAGGELKHGTLALIEPGYPVIAVAPRIKSTAKMVGNIQEVKARGARVIGVISEGDTELEGICDERIFVPETLPAFLPILAVIPLQLFAYDMAKTLGRNIDRPRNLAKSVTVE